MVISRPSAWPALIQQATTWQAITTRIICPERIGLSGKASFCLVTIGLESNGLDSLPIEPVAEPWAQGS